MGQNRIVGGHGHGHGHGHHGGGGGHHGHGHGGPAGGWGPGGWGWDEGVVYVEGASCVPGDVAPGGWVCDPSGKWQRVGESGGRVGGTSVINATLDSSFAGLSVKAWLAGAAAGIVAFLVMRK